MDATHISTCMSIFKWLCIRGQNHFENKESTAYSLWLPDLWRQSHVNDVYVAYMPLEHSNHIHLEKYQLRI